MCFVRRGVVSSHMIMEYKMYILSLCSTVRRNILDLCSYKISYHAEWQKSFYSSSGNGSPWIRTQPPLLHNGCQLRGFRRSGNRRKQDLDCTVDGEKHPTGVLWLLPVFAKGLDARRRAEAVSQQHFRRVELPWKVSARFQQCYCKKNLSQWFHHVTSCLSKQNLLHSKRIGHDFPRGRGSLHLLPGRSWLMPFRWLSSGLRFGGTGSMFHIQWRSVTKKLSQSDF